jgi:hypothetical protein
MMCFRKLIFVLAIILFASACTKQSRNDVPEKVDSEAQWVQELAKKNPLKDSINITSVYFRFDTIINDFEVNYLLSVLLPRIWLGRSRKWCVSLFSLP